MMPALHALLDRGTTAPDDAVWMEDLARWLMGFRTQAVGQDCPRTQALSALTEALNHREDGEVLRNRIRAFWSHTSAVRLLAEVGLADHPTFLREAVQRISDRLLPRVDPVGDLYAFVDRLQPTEDDVYWLRSLPEDLLEVWGELLQPDPESRTEAMRLLAFRIAALGLSRDLLRLFPGRADLASPFAALPAAILEPDQSEEVLGRSHEELHQCRLRLEAQGVSTDLVYRLDLLEASLVRLGELLALEREDGRVLELAAQLVEGASAQHHLRPLLRNTLRRLARKVVEHSGETGEHYLARTRRDFWAMGAAAAGGGALTALTALVKVLLSTLPLAPGLLGLAHAMNYAGSFAIMQFLHFSLASKQPAATAAALAGALDGPRNYDSEVGMVAAISRGQVAATLGNLLLAMPTALLVDALWRLITGHPVLDAGLAAYTFTSIHPFQSWTLPFAAFTGVLLFFGSLAGGWAHNWSAHRNLPESVARSHRLQTLLGRTRAAHLGAWLGHHLPGLAACIALGLLLGLFPVVLAFAGLPLDVRHVTLSSASLALALGQGLATGHPAWAQAAWGLLGVVLIGTLNFGVSFLLSLRLAIQARGLAEVDRRSLSQALLKAFLQNPGRFLWARRSND